MNLEDFIAASLHGPTERVIIPGVGHRTVTKDSLGRITDETGKVYNDKKEFKEDGQRSQVGNLANQLIPVTNSIVLNGMHTLKSFKAMKESLLNDLDVDSETINNLEDIERYIESTLTKYLEKKEELKRTFSLRDIR